MSQITEQLVTVTEEAKGIVRDALANEPGGESLSLWIEVRGVEAGKFAYDLYFQSSADAGDDDALVVDGDLTIVVPSSSIARLSGARLEFSEEGGGGLVMINPNNPTPEEMAPGVPAEVLAQGLDGELATKLADVLEREVNPSIAAHGGRADLVALDAEAGVAYLALSGGCQGCAGSRATLSQGIEVILLEQVPEVTQIVDVTDHASGANPYYAQ
jgi:Fe/S biogenesis protein NfuA